MDETSQSQGGQKKPPIGAWRAIKIAFTSAPAVFGAYLLYAVFFNYEGGFEWTALLVLPLMWVFVSWVYFAVFRELIDSETFEKLYGWPIRWWDRVHDTDDPEWRTIEDATHLSYLTYLRSEPWQQRRDFMLRQANYRCTQCQSGTRLEVHHLTYKRLGRERVRDLTVLCHDCHAALHGKGKIADYGNSN